MLGYNFVNKGDVWPSIRQLPWLPDGNNDILLSFPRSGNTFVRYFLEYVTRRPTWGYSTILLHLEDLSAEGFTGTAMDFPLLYWCRKLTEYFKVDLQGHLLGKPIFKRHVAKNDVTSGSWQFFDAKDNLILLIRDPIECISRNLDLHKSNKNKSKIKGQLEDFYSNLALYDAWNGKKMCLYYEDMINDPSTFFQKLGSFFDADPLLVKSFLSNYENHRQIALSLYDITKENNPEASGSVTKGKTTKFYCSLLDDNLVEAFKKDVIKNEYYEKYLKRYEY